jgi:spore germination protein YaaH
MQDLTSNSLADEQFEEPLEASEGQAESQAVAQPEATESQASEEVTAAAEEAPPVAEAVEAKTVEEVEPVTAEAEAVEEEVPAPAEEAALPAEETPPVTEAVEAETVEEVEPVTAEAVEEETPAPAEETTPPTEETPPVTKAVETEVVEEEAPAPAEEAALPAEETPPVTEAVEAVMPEEVEPTVVEAETVEEEAPPVAEAAEVTPPEKEAALPTEEALPAGPSFSEWLQETFASVRERLGATFTVLRERLKITLGPLGERLGATLAPLREKLKVALGPFGERLSATFAPLRERIGDNTWIYGVIGVVALLVILALFIPPFSLLQRLGITGYTAITAETDNNNVEHPDGIRVAVPATYEGKLRVRLESVPRADFLGFAHSSYREAVEALPAHLEVKSPFYKISVRGKNDQQVMIDAAMPVAAEPWETLDLYTWTGETWEWVGGELHTEVAEKEFVRAWVTDVPDNVVVVQTGTTTQTISTLLEAEDNLVSGTGVVDEVNPTGLAMGPDGTIMGVLSQAVDVNAFAVMPTISEPTAHGPLADVLAMSDIQKSHIAQIIELCINYGFAGVEIAYRGILPEEREAYTAYITALADALHAEGLRLNVVVEPATLAGTEWSTGGYDWQAIGAVADAIKVPFPDDPAAYADSGEAQRLLAWATAQIPRAKLRLQVSSLSVEQRSGEISHVSIDKALAPFGEVTTVDGVTEVAPNNEIKFTFSGIDSVRGIVPQDAAGTYRIEYADKDTTYTVWLGTAANLAVKLQWAQRYHLGGVAVDGLLNPGNAPGIVEAVNAYRAATTPPTGQQAQVVWMVTSPAAELAHETLSLTEPNYSWMVVAATGTYTVKATIAGVERGSVEVAVADTVAPTPAPTPLADTASAPVSADCLNASFVSETVPDGTKFDKGESFTKSWTLSNSGTCDWPENTKLVKISSDTGGADSVPVGAVAVGETKEIQVELTAPEEDGSFRSDWALKVGDAQIFEVYALVAVGDASSSTSVAVATGPMDAGSFELGGHIRDMAFPYSDKMKYAGMTWAKVQVRYAGDANAISAAAHSKGFKIQVSALGAANMVTQAGFEDQYANWVAGMATAGADAIEVWNEPNIDAEWAVGHISPQAYTSLLCKAYSAIKGANPNTIVISAATAPTGYFGGCGPNGCDDLPFIQGMYNAGAAGCMDYLGAHHNSGATRPSARSGHPADDGNRHHSWYFLPQTELYYRTFGSSRKLFYTEMGYASQEGLPAFSDHFGWARGINNSQQAAWLAEAVQLSINTGMVRCIIVWNIDFVRYGHDPQDGYAIIRPGGACPACDSLHNVLGSR